MKAATRKSSWGVPIPEPPDIDRKWPINKHPAIAGFAAAFWLSLFLATSNTLHYAAH
jgi:hypothetical protein